MENEELVSLIIDEATKLEKIRQRMRSKYVFGDGPMQETLEKDAKEWAYWRKLGLR